MERVVFEGKERATTITDNGATNQYDNFAKLQESLYSKFHNAELNKRRIPIHVDSSPAFGKKSAKGDDNKSEFEHSLLDKLFFRNENGENDPFHLFKGVRPRKEKKVSKKSGLHFENEGRRLFDMEKYSKLDVEKEVNEMQIDEEEERKCIHQLNRNIKLQRPKSTTSHASFSGTVSTRSTAAGSLGFVDIDSYFANKVEHLICSKDDEKSKPQEFSK